MGRKGFALPHRSQQTPKYNKPTVITLLLPVDSKVTPSVVLEVVTDTADEIFSLVIVADVLGADNRGVSTQRMATSCVWSQ